MFSWATSTFESLAQTVAPPPSDPSSKIYMACCKRNEDSVLQLLQENIHTIHPIHTIIYESKGYTLFHLACLYSLSNVLQYCIDTCQQQAMSVPLHNLLDQEGNTPLHCASMSTQTNALDMVKLLLSIETSLNAANSNTGSNATNAPIVTIPNKNGQTPYDVATINSIRQYLLPIQLQAETTIALQNGGIGLPPGIDMGGLKITNSHLPPPPTAPSIMTATPSTGSYQSYESQQQQATTPRYAPIPGLNVVASNSASTTATNLYSTAPGSLPNQQQQQQFPYDPANYAHDATSSSQQAPSQQQQQQQQQQQFAPTPTTTMMPPIPVRQQQQVTVSSSSISSDVSTPTGTNTSSSSSSSNSNSNNNSNTNIIPRAPSSGNGGSGYALTGRSSAAIFKPTKGGIQPDGFHSSSSDKNLQEKYGHVNVTNINLPPPPSSGGTTPILSLHHTNQTLSAPSSMNGGTNNPFAGGLSALGGAATGGGRTVARRYVSYDPFAATTGTNHLPPPAPSASPYSPYNQFQPPSQQQHQIFNPANSAPANAYNSFRQPSLQHSTSMPVETTSSSNTAVGNRATTVSFTIPQEASTYTNFSSPTTDTFASSNIGKTPANTPMIPTTTAAATTTFMSPPPSGITSSSFSTGVIPQPFSSSSSSSPDRSGSSVHAASVFGTPVVAAGSSTDATSENLGGDITMTTPPPQQNVGGYHRSNSNPLDVAALFSKPANTTASTSTTTNTGSNASSITDVTKPIQQQQEQPTIASATSTTSAIELFGTTNNNRIAGTTSDTEVVQELHPSQIPEVIESSDVATAKNNDVNNNADDELQDIPLTPGQEPKYVPNTPNMTNVTNVVDPIEQQYMQTQQPQSVVTSSVNSLISAIGMPPPPFSRR